MYKEIQVIYYQINIMFDNSLVNHWNNLVDPLYKEGLFEKVYEVSHQELMLFQPYGEVKEIGVYYILELLIMNTIERSEFAITKSFCDILNEINLNFIDVEDFGERSFYNGIVEFEIGSKDKALEYFQDANKLSKGRCFTFINNVVKYKKFYKENIKK